MGQKVNPIIFRLGLKNSTWKFRYFGKTKEDLGFYIYQICELKKYLKRFFERNGSILFNFKIDYKFNKIRLIISYFFNSNLMNSINKHNRTQEPEIEESEETLFESFYKNQSLLYKNQSLLYKNDYLKQFLECLKRFTYKKIDISVKLQRMNKSLYLNLTKDEKRDLKTIVLSLRKYAKNEVLNKNEVLKTVLNVCYLIVKFKNAVDAVSTLSALLVNQISKVKIKRLSVNVYIYFLEQCLSLFFRARFSRLNGIKIVIKGKLGRTKRARTSTILIGEVPIQSVSSSVKYSSNVVFTSSGAVGIQAWIHEKSIF